MDGHPPPNCRSPSFQGLLPLNKNILDFLWKWKSWNGWWRFWIYGSIGCNFCSKPCPNLYLYFLSFFFVSFCVQIRVQTWLKKASISSISLIAIQVNCFYTPTNPLVLKDFRLKGEICEWVGTTPAWIFLNLGGHPRGEGQVKQDLKNLDGHDSALDLSWIKFPFLHLSTLNWISPYTCLISWLSRSILKVYSENNVQFVKDFSRQRVAFLKTLVLLWKGQLYTQIGQIVT